MNPKKLWITLFVAPGVFLMAVFMLLPAASALGYSLFEWNAFTMGKFVGLDNFYRLFGSVYRGQFFAALSHNVLTFLAVITVQNGLALALALALYRRPWGFKFFRGTVFLPVILSLVITGYLWELFLHPLFGPLTKLAMGALHLENFAPLGDSDLALPTAIIISIWRNVGFPTLVFLAGMNAIPDDLYRAAEIDGASEWSVFRHITLPLLGPSFTIVLILSFIGAMEWFDLPYVIGGPTGNPGNALDTLALMFYRLSFGDGSAAVTDVGLGAAVSVVLFTLVLLGSRLGANYLRKREVQMS